ncbi:MAG: hypothetical protein ACUVSV_06440 [Armatimonadota bacterium]
MAEPHYLTRLDFVLIIASAGSYTNVTADIEVYNAWNPDASVDSVFSNLAGAFTADLGDFNPTGATGYLITLDVPSGIVLDTNPNKGVVVTLKNNGVLDSVPPLGVVNRPPNLGSEVVTAYGIAMRTPTASSRLAMPAPLAHPVLTTTSLSPCGLSPFPNLLRF